MPFVLMLGPIFFFFFMSTEYVLSVYANIMVRCTFLPYLQLFATTNLAHLTFVTAMLLPHSNCARSSGPSLRNS